ncbi:MAG TPA: aminotransferase class V-fold PLP-dependent enzyme [Phycisphaerae bacterium]|jgi:cysteine desulfurase family protein
MSDVIYFDNAATSWPKPAVVAERMSAFLQSEAANPGRAGHRMAVGAEKTLDGVRKLLTDFVGGTDFHRMVFALNATDALNIAMKGLLRQGDHVITTALEHNSISRPLQAMADSGFITLTRMGFSPETGVVDPAEMERAITGKTRMIAMTHASNVLGTIQPIEEIGRIARAKGVKFLVDGAQTIGVAPLNVKRMNIDVLAFPGHKSLLGPTGTGGLYVDTTLGLEEFHAFREGGTGGDSSTPTQPKLFPYFLEGGTPNTVGIAGLGAAVEYVIAHNPAKTLAHERGMVQRIISTVLANPKFTLYGPKNADNRVGTVSFNVEGYTPQEVGSILDESFSIAVRPGLHCSPYAHKGIGTFPDGAVRVSPGQFNTEEELGKLLAALEELGT